MARKPTVPSGHHYVIDGYNLIHAHPELKPLLEIDPKAAREGLLNFLEDRFALLPAPAICTVIFDGAGGRGSFRRSGADSPVKYRFSQPPESADDLICRLMSEKAFPSSVTVVSSDDKDITRRLRLNRMRTLRSDKFLESLPTPELHRTDEPVDEELEREVRAYAIREEPPGIEVHSGWVSIQRGRNIEAVFLDISGDCQVRKDSQPEGVQLTAEPGRITLVNSRNSISPYDILFEFTGKLKIISCRMIARNGQEIALAVKYIKT